MEVKNTAPFRLHVVFACLGLAFLLIFSWVLFHEETAEWRTVQARFRQLENRVKNPHQLAQSASVGGLRQIWLPALGRVDRCGTCHLGIDDPAFASAPPPFGAHPGTWLSTHPTDRFGCTSCHDGQGQANRLRQRGAQVAAVRVEADATARDDRSELRDLPPLARPARRAPASPKADG